METHPHVRGLEGVPFCPHPSPHLDGRKRVCFVVVLARRESGAILMQRSDVISAGKGKCGRGGLDPEKKAPPPPGIFE